MALSWVSVNALDGSIIADLPTLRVDGALKQTIGRHETQTAVLPLTDPAIPDDPMRPPSNWRTATREKAAFLVALDESRGGEQPVPVWGGLVIDREESHLTEVPIALATAEDYLNDRYVGDEEFYTWPQNSIVRYLVEKYAAADGIPIRVVELPGPNPVRGRTYLDQEDKSLYSVLDELSGVIDGPEWTISWEWVGEKLGMVFTVGARLGSPAPDGLGPAAQFHLPGNLTGAKIKKGYRRGEGANDVMATSSGAADARPQSGRKRNAMDGRPRVEFRWSPSSSITEIATLDGHADRALAAMQAGTVELSLTADRSVQPFLGRDWHLGDDVGFDLTSWAWPDGITGTARVISTEITDTTITPVLDVTGIEGIGD